MPQHETVLPANIRSPLGANDIISKIEALVEGQNYLVVYTDSITFPSANKIGVTKSKFELEKMRKMSNQNQD